MATYDYVSEQDENILIHPDTLEVRIIDFGTSAFLSGFGDGSLFTDYTGTFEYAVSIRCI